MAFTQKQIEEVQQFREHASAFAPCTKIRDICQLRYSDEELVLMPALRRIACEVVIARTSIDDAKARLAEITDLVREECIKDSYLVELIKGVEDLIAYVESENRELVS